MVYITVGSAANPILEFLEEWGTENFEVCFISLSIYPHALTSSYQILRLCFFVSFWYQLQQLLIWFWIHFNRRYHLQLFLKLLKYLLMVVGLEFIGILTYW
jgi:hypothetical protein